MPFLETKSILNMRLNGKFVLIFSFKRYFFLIEIMMFFDVVDEMHDIFR